MKSNPIVNPASNASPTTAQSGVQARNEAVPDLSAEGTGKRAATIAVTAALQTTSYLDMVRYLNTYRMAFGFHGWKPCVVANGHRYHLHTLALIPALEAAFRRWEGLGINFDKSTPQTNALKLRLEWMAHHNYSADLPGQMWALSYFSLQPGLKATARAIAATAKEKIRDRTERVQHFVRCCHHLINGRPTPA